MCLLDGPAPEDVYSRIAMAVSVAVAADADALPHDTLRSDDDGDHDPDHDHDHGGDQAAEDSELADVHNATAAADGEKAAQHAAGAASQLPPPSGGAGSMQDAAASLPAAPESESSSNILTSMFLVGGPSSHQPALQLPRGQHRNAQSQAKPMDTQQQLEQQPKAQQHSGLSVQEMAGRVRNEVDRKLVKQTVMTTVYGVTALGARDQVINRYVPLVL